MSSDAQPADPLEELLDILVYGPVGLALAAREALPGWIDRGRRQLAVQLPLARTLGEMAVRYGWKQARESLDRLRRQADDIVSEMSGARSGAARPAGPPDDSDQPPPGAAAPRVVPQDEAGGDGGEVPSGTDDGSLPGDEADVGPPLGGRSSPAAGELPIPGYDSLSASQVVQRLPGLSVEELEAVRSYELAGRARKTVLLRVAQLRAAS